MCEDLTEVAEVSIRISVPPHQLHKSLEFCQNYIRSKENKIINGKIGYLCKFHKIIHLQYSDINFQLHNGSVIFNVLFQGSFINPKIGNTMRGCKVIRNDDISFVIKPPLCIIILQRDDIQDLEATTLRIMEISTDKSNNVFKIIAKIETS